PAWLATACIWSTQVTVAFLALTPPAEYAEGFTGELAYLRNVRFGSKADIEAPPTNVCFTPKSGHWNSVGKCPLCAKSRHQITLSNHLVGAGTYRWRHGEAKPFSGLEIDH